MTIPKTQTTQDLTGQAADVGLLARPFSGISLRTKLVVAFLVVALLPVGLLAVFNFWETQRQAIRNANQSLESAALQTADEIDGFIRNNLSTVRVESKLSLWAQYFSLPANERVGSDLEAEVISTLNDLSRKGQTFSAAYVPSYALIDRQGVTVLDTLSQSVGEFNGNEDFFQAALQTGQPYVSPVIFSEPDGEAMLIFSSPIRNTANEFMGVLRIRYNAAILQEQIFQNSNLAGSESAGILLDQNYVRLADPKQPKLTYKSVTPLDPAMLSELQAEQRLPRLPAGELSTNLPEFAQGLSNPTNASFSAVIHPGQEVEQVAVEKLKTQPWLVAFVQPRSVFLNPVNNQLIISLGLVLVALVVAILLAVLFSVWLTRPVTELTAAAEQVRGGDLTAQVRVRSTDEIGTLAATFNNMTGQLGKLIGEQQYRTLRLAIVVNLGERLSSILNFDALLSELAIQVQTRLGYHHARVYVVHDTAKSLELVATDGRSDTEDKALIQQIEAKDLAQPVAQAARTGEIVTLPKGLEADIWRADAPSVGGILEVAVPIILDGKVVAVLDLEETRFASLDDEEENLLRSLTNQVAVTIRNARLFEEVEDALNDARSTYERYVARSWTQDRIRGQQRRYHYEQSAASGLEEAVQAKTKQLALNQNRPVVVSLMNNLQGNEAEWQTVKPNAIAAPIMLQDLKIGTVQLHRTDSDQSWTDDDLAMVEAVIDQLVQTAENLRLFEETRERAGREQTLRSITDKLRTAPNLERLAAIAAEELGQHLLASYAELELGIDAVSNRSLKSTVEGNGDGF